MARRAKAKPKPKGRKSTAGTTDDAQSARFIETARQLGVDESGGDFERALEQILPPKKQSKGSRRR